MFMGQTQISSITNTKWVKQLEEKHRNESKKSRLKYILVKLKFQTIRRFEICYLGKVLADQLCYVSTVFVSCN